MDKCGGETGEANNMKNSNFEKILKLKILGSQQCTTIYYFCGINPLTLPILPPAYPFFTRETAEELSDLVNATQV